MSTHTQLIYHIAYGTYKRQPTMVSENKRRLYAYMNGFLKNKNCHLYRINGMEDHLHILTHIHPTVALATLVKDIKLASIDFIKSEGIFPDFDGWQNGYGAFTVSQRDKDQLINYIKNQETHHKKESFYDEYKRLIEEHGIEFDEKYLL
jgi:REP element-mobilizing transposase RayT